MLLNSSKHAFSQLSLPYFMHNQRFWPDNVGFLVEYLKPSTMVGTFEYFPNIIRHVCHIYSKQKIPLLSHSMQK
jgi:hypothetical protein